MRWLWVIAALIALTLGGCTSSAPNRSSRSDSGPDRIPRGVLSQPDPVPRDEPLSASGNSLSYVVFGKRYYRLPTARNFDETGVASWYGRKFHGRLTASGEPYDMYKMTAAHKSIPLPTFARVTNLENRRSVVVRINDRGPFVGERLIDLSYAAAAKLDMLKAGTAKVRVVALSGVPSATPTPEPLVQIAAGGQPLTQGVFVKPYEDPKPIISPLPGSEAPAEANRTQPPPSAVLASASGRFLQIGAYGSFAAADELRERLQGAVAGEVFVSKLPTSALFRVRIGPFATGAQLAAARVTLREQHSIDAIVVAVAEARQTCC